jgi:hypothetical protein
MLQKG